MTILAFFLGLAIGIGIWLYWRVWFYKQVGQLLRSLPAGASNISLPPLSRLRYGISLANRQQQDLETEILSWQQILQAAPLGYLVVDEENQLLWCNQQAQQLLHLDRWEPGQVRLLLELVRSYELDQLIEQTRQQQQPQTQEWAFHPSYPDAEAIGRSASIALLASSWPLADGRVGVFLENRQALVELLAVRDRSFSDLAHELRTPLTSIRLVAETLETRLNPPLLRLVQRMLPEINRLINLVQDWLELSQLEIDPSSKLNRKPSELKSLIHSVWQTLEPLARSKQLSLDYSGPDVVWIEADESRLYRVFLNILDNSIKYSPNQGIIRTEINLLPQIDDRFPRVEIKIIDSGPGFPESDLPHVFERLFRGDPSRTRNSSVAIKGGMQGSKDEANMASKTGSGLGLAIVKQIVLAHGGAVTASNHPNTGGALVKIELPYC
jgi:two-component system, OmpR family, phosphate regulon sensor histidine kinase PhoR